MPFSCVVCYKPLGDEKKKKKRERERERVCWKSNQSVFFNVKYTVITQSCRGLMREICCVKCVHLITLF